MRRRERRKKKSRKRERRLYFRWGTMSNYIVVSSNKTRVKDEKRNIMKNYFHFLLHARSLMDSCLAFQQLIIIEDMLWSRYFISISSSMKRSRRCGRLIKPMVISSQRMHDNYFSTCLYLQETLRKNHVAHPFARGKKDLLLANVFEG